MMHQFIYELFRRAAKSDKKQCVEEKIEKEAERVGAAVTIAFIYYSFTRDLERAYKRFIEEVCG